MSVLTRKLGDIADFINGRAFKPEEWENTGLPIIRIQNLNDSQKPFNYTSQTHKERFRVKTGDTLFSWSGTPGTSFGCFAWEREEGWLNQHIFNVKFFEPEHVDKNFFIRSVNSKLTEIIDQAHGGVGLKHITKKKLLEVKIPLPPLSEQKRIAGILDAADRLRAKRREALAQLDTLLQSLFLDLFGDPVTNPKGWEVTRLGDTAKRITKGQSPKWQGFDYQNDGALFVTSENVRDGHLNISKPKYVPLEFNDKLKGSQLIEGDLLINLVGASIGRSCLFKGFSGAANVNQAVGIVTINDALLSNYIVQLLQTKQGQSFLTGRIVEAARANISLKNLRELEIPLPPLPLQQRFAAIVEQVEAQKTRMRTQLTELDTLFAALQQRAFNGEL